MTVRINPANPASNRGDTGYRESITNAILKALQKEMSKPVAEITLYDHIEPEALDSLVEHATANSGVVWDITFTVEEWTVRVSSDGEITVSERAEPAEGT